MIPEVAMMQVSQHREEYPNHELDEQRQIFLQRGDQQDLSEMVANKDATWEVKTPSFPCKNHMEVIAQQKQEACWDS